MRVHRLARFQRAVRIGHHDVGRQRIALRAQPVHDPRAHAGETRHDAAGEQFVLRRRVDDHVAVARADDGEVVDALGRVREQVGDFDAALAVFLKRALGAEQLAHPSDELILRLAELRRPRLAVQLVQQRLGIEGLEVARPAGHERKMTDFAFGGQMRRLGAPAD